jgi:hypothetical protein
MDMVIFTGRLAESELQHERPAEFERITQSGELDALIVRPPSERSWLAGRFFGTSTVVIGLALVALIIYAVATHGF